MVSQRNVRRNSNSSNDVHGGQRQQHEPTAPPLPRPAELPPPPPPPRRRHDVVAPATTRGAGAGAIADAETAESKGDVVVVASSRERASSCGHGEFGPAMGVCVVAAVSMAGLLGGRLWAVVCVCAWLAAVYGLQLNRRRAKPPPPPAADGGGEEVVGDVNSKDYKKLVVLKGLLQRDRR